LLVTKVPALSKQLAPMSAALFLAITLSIHLLLCADNVLPAPMVIPTFAITAHRS
jgi:hypothetical protein